jgi:hypothetical protein
VRIAAFIIAAGMALGHVLGTLISFVDRLWRANAFPALRSLAFYFTISLCLCLTIFASSPLTQVLDTIVWPNGTTPSGTAIISWGRTLNNDRQPVAAGQMTITITNGVVNVSLLPLDVALPVGTCYSFQATLNGQVQAKQYWFVPTSATPVTLAQIQTSIPCAVQSGVIVAPAQINPGPAGQTLVLTSPGTGVPQWLPSTGGSGTAIVTLTITGARTGTFTTIKPGSFLRCQDQATNGPVIPFSAGSPLSANPVILFSTNVSVTCYALSP